MTQRCSSAAFFSRPLGVASLGVPSLGTPSLGLSTLDTSSLGMSSVGIVPPRRAGPGSMDRAGLDQLEEPHFRLELRPVGALHVEGSGHRPKRCRKRASRRVFKGLPGFEGGLLPYHARSVDFFGMARPVDDRPVAVQELDDRVALIRDPNRVEKEPAARRRAAVFVGVARPNADADAASFGFGGRFEWVGVTHAADSSRRFAPSRSCRLR